MILSEPARVFILLGIAVVFFAFEWVSAEVVALGLLLGLIAFGILDVSQAFAGFGSDTVMMILGLLIMTTILAQTGVIDVVGRWIQKKSSGKKTSFLPILLCTVGTVSCFVSNTASAAFFIPIVLAMARRLKVTPSRYLMPMAFVSILAGSMTLIGTSTNMVVSGMMQQGGLSPMGMFELTPVAAVFLVIGLIYLLTLGQKLIPERDAVGSLQEVLRSGHYLTEIRVTQDSTLAGKSLRELQFGEKLDLTVLRITRSDHNVARAAANTKLRAGDVLLVEGGHEAILKVKNMAGLEIKGDVKLSLSEEGSSDEERVVEAVLLPGSTLIDQSLKSSGFRDRFGAVALGLKRHGENLIHKISHIPLRVGDMLLLQGSVNDLRALEDMGAFRLVGESAISQPARKKAWLSSLIFLAALCLGIFKIMPLPAAALTGAFMMLACRCAKSEDVYRMLDWKVLILIACMLSVGVAMITSGSDKLIGAWLANWAVQVNTTWLLTGLFILTVVLSQPMSNQAAAALVLPIAIQVAHQMNLDPRPLAMTVAIAAGCSFLTPLEPASLMVYGLGGYKFRDFFIVGLPLTLIVLVVTVLMVPIIWPLHL